MLTRRIARRKLGLPHLWDSYRRWFVPKDLQYVQYSLFVPIIEKGSRISIINYFGNDGPLGFMEMENDEDDEVGSFKCTMPSLSLIFSL